jgi:hypothetical protein
MQAKVNSDLSSSVKKFKMIDENQKILLQKQKSRSSIAGFQRPLE